MFRLPFFSSQLVYRRLIVDVVFVWFSQRYTCELGKAGQHTSSRKASIEFCTKGLWISTCCGTSACDEAMFSGACDDESEAGFTVNDRTVRSNVGRALVESCDNFRWRREKKRVVLQDDAFPGVESADVIFEGQIIVFDRRLGRFVIVSHYVN